MLKHLTKTLLLITTVFLLSVPVFASTEVIDRGDEINYEITPLSNYTTDTTIVLSSARTGFTTPRQVKVYSEDGLQVNQNFQRNVYKMTVNIGSGLQNTGMSTANYRYEQPISVSARMVDPARNTGPWWYSGDWRYWGYGYTYNGLSGYKTSSGYSQSFTMPAYNITESFNTSRYYGTSSHHEYGDRAKPGTFEWHGYWGGNHDRSMSSYMGSGGSYSREWNSTKSGSDDKHYWHSGSGSMRYDGITVYWDVSLSYAGYGFDYATMKCDGTTISSSAGKSGSARWCEHYDYWT